MSRPTDTAYGSPSPEPRASTARASRAAVASPAAVTARTRRRPAAGSTSTPNVRSRGSPSAATAADTAVPQTGTSTTASADGRAPRSTRTPAASSAPASSSSYAAVSGRPPRTRNTGRSPSPVTGLSGAGPDAPSPYAYQPRPVLRPCSPAATRFGVRKEGRSRSSWRKPCQIESITAAVTSRPVRSISSKGPIRSPRTSRAIRSIAAGSATDSSSNASASVTSPRPAWLTRKPGVSATVTAR